MQAPVYAGLDQGKGASIMDDSTIRKRSVIIAGHSTSVSLEAAFWDGLKEIATVRGLSVNGLIEQIDGERTGNLSSAIRVFVLRQCCGQGHGKEEVG
jgi:predicted DNA-binding ribbon-helix-helix protein